LPSGNKTICCGIFIVFAIFVLALSLDILL